MLQVKNLSISFGSAVNVVDRVSLNLQPGKITCLVGESGSGKSLTSMSIMNLLGKNAVISNESQILFNGKNLLELSEREYQDILGNEISMIFQEPMTSLNPLLTIGEQVSEAVIRHQKLPKEQAKELVLEQLLKVKIKDPDKTFTQYPHELSGGMRQRVMIAMALINKPRLLIADEPTTALDVTVQAEVLKLIKDLQTEYGMSVLFITHDLGVVYEIADNVAVMYAGKIVEFATADELFSNATHPYTLGLMSSIPSYSLNKERLFSISGSVPSIEEMPKGCRFSTRCNFATNLCHTQEPMLEEIASTHSVSCIKIPLEVHA